MFFQEAPDQDEKGESHKTLFGRLVSFVDSDEDLNPLLAGYFSKLLGLLIASKPDET